jgi:hypothetical protein
MPAWQAELEQRYLQVLRLPLALLPTAAAATATAAAALLGRRLGLPLLGSTQVVSCQGYGLASSQALPQKQQQQQQRQLVGMLRAPRNRPQLTVLPLLHLLLFLLLGRMFWQASAAGLGAYHVLRKPQQQLQAMTGSCTMMCLGMSSH